MAFSYSRTVYLADTDAAGVVYFASVMNMCHEAYEESLAQAGINWQDFVTNSMVAVPIVHAEVSFFRPMFCGDKLLIKLVPKKISDHKFAIDYQIFSTTSAEKPLARGNTKHVCINSQTRSKVDLPISIIQWLQACS
ncbi:MAG: thioesterase family protein [Xenococcaceae cyanobacterium MO_188.B32]|nr:thioesterase family protein [Xenococcaceae cyanobacterium MO_188.B32]